MTVPVESSRELHRNADTDGSPQTLHHTLGSGRFQASPGSHIHDGGDSVLLLGDVTITGSRSSGAALVSVIEALTKLGATDATST